MGQHGFKGNGLCIMLFNVQSCRKEILKLFFPFHKHAKDKQLWKLCIPDDDYDVGLKCVVNFTCSKNTLILFTKLLLTIFSCVTLHNC